MRRASLLIAIAVLATLAVPILVGGTDALAATLAFPLQGYLALFGVILASWVARALKLLLLLRRLGLHARFGEILAISLAIDFAFISTPAGVGGYAAAVYYLRRPGASISAATTVTAADQILDLAFFAIVLPGAAVGLLWSELPRGVALVAFAAGCAMLALGVAAVVARGRLARWLADNPLVRRWPALRRRQDVLREFLASLGANTRLLMSGGAGTAVAIVALTALQWLTRYGVLWTALALLGERVSFAMVLLLQSLILHAAMWTGVPSGGGGAELGLTAALTAWVPATTMAAALLLWRLVTFDLCLVVGVGAVLWLAHRRPAPHQPAQAPAAGTTAAQSQART